MPEDFNTKVESPAMLHTSTGFFILKPNVEIGRAEILQWIRNNADRDTLNKLDIAGLERHNILDDEEEAQRDPRSMAELSAQLTMLAGAM